MYSRAHTPICPVTPGNSPTAPSIFDAQRELICRVVCTQIMEWEDADTSFAPLIIKSVNSSMLRSAAFNRMVGSAESKLSNTTQGKGVFHATVG